MRPAAPAVGFCLDVPARDEDVAIALLAEHGTIGIEHAPADPERSVLIAYFEAGSAAEQGLRAAIASIEDARIEPRAVPAVDWVARFRESFRAFDAAGFRIVPEWERPDGELPSRTLVVDPGRAFGTGTHETTRLCLAALERLAGEGGLGRVVDLGTGTGLLALAALRLGAVSAVGIDNDPEALVSARDHARRNDAPLLLIGGDCGRPLRPRLFDTVVANLTAPLLLARKDEICGLRRPRGRLVLSGLLLSDLDAIRAAYASAGSVTAAEDGDWAAVVVGAGEP